MMIILKAIIIQALFLAVYHTILKRHKSFTFNRFFLLFGLLSVLCFSWVEIEIPHYVTVQHSELLIPLDHELTAIPWQPSYNYEYLITLVLLGCSVLIFCTRSWQLVSLAADRLGYSSKGYEVRELPALRRPFSFWPRIYMSSQDYHNPEYAMIIRHEEIHLSKLHSLDILIGELIAALLWFSPLSWLYLRAIKNTHEYEVDEHFAGDAAELSEYLQLLYKSWSLTGPIMASRFDFTTNKNRILMLTSERNNLSIGIMTFAIGIVIIPMILISCTEKTVFVDEEITEELAKPNFKAAILDTFPEPPVPPPPPPSLSQSSDASELESTNQGFVMTRITTEQRNSIPTPLTGMIIFNTEENCVQVNLGPPENPFWDCLVENGLLHSLGLDSISIIELVGPQGPIGAPPPPPPPPPPPRIKKPSSTQVDQWINEHETYGLWLDNKRIVNSELRKIINDEDIYYYSIQELSSRGQKVANCENAVNLMSETRYSEFFDNIESDKKAFIKMYDEWKEKYGHYHIKNVDENFKEAEKFWNTVENGN